MKCAMQKEKMLCRTYLGLKELDEYDDTDKSTANIDWEEDMVVIVKATKHPIFGIETTTNVNWSSIPDEIQEKIKEWANGVNLSGDTNNVGVIKTFLK